MNASAVEYDPDGAAARMRDHRLDAAAGLAEDDLAVARLVLRGEHLNHGWDTWAWIAFIVV